MTEPEVSGVIIGPRSPEQVAQMCACLDVPLTDADRADLVALLG